MTKRCIFCWDTAQLTREHIRADWLKNYLPKTQVNYEAGHLTINRPGLPRSEKSRKIGGDPLSRRVKCVCEACNTRWMKDIQDAAKPIVVPMIGGQRVPLRRPEQRTLAAWIAMSVMCSEFGKDQLQAISPADRETLYRHKVPPKRNWQIWLGRYQRKVSANEWDHRALLILPAKKVSDGATPDGRTHNTQSTTYTVGELFIHVVSSDWAKCISNFRVVQDRHLVRLWPRNGSPVVWPPARILSDEEAARIAAGFFDGLRRAGTR